jgi:hypothetical protein
MNDRNAIDRELSAIEQEQRELEILYEQYFAGVEKREPVKLRETLGIRLRRFANRRIMQTDLRFRYQGLATRHHSYVRQKHQLRGGGSAEPPPADTGDEVDVIYRELLAVRLAQPQPGPLPERQQVAAFLEKQKEKIREKFGDREVEFRVVTEDGKPKIKVRAKSPG